MQPNLPSMTAIIDVEIAASPRSSTRRFGKWVGITLHLLNTTSPGAFCASTIAPELRSPTVAIFAEYTAAWVGTRPQQKIDAAMSPRIFSLSGYGPVLISKSQLP
ncbi:MAG: hypothetical protein U1F40_06210 [Turneriella sp.]